MVKYVDYKVLPTDETKVLRAGRWFMIPQDERNQLMYPKEIKVYEGSSTNRREVARITKSQAMAYMRWYFNDDFYYRGRSDKWQPVRVCGDTDAWYGL